MIGTGFIGGKSVGMLIARSILAKEKSLGTEKLLEPHDSFYIGSDVFYTYIVENGLWKDHMAQRTQEGYFEMAHKLHEELSRGVFPEEIKDQFQQMIEYFGQSPIIVRSSSLLEDSYGNGGWIRWTNKWRFLSSGSREPTIRIIFFRTQPVSGSRRMFLSGSRAWIPRRACFAWSWGWGLARSIASKGIIRASWPWTSHFSRLTRGWQPCRGFDSMKSIF
jgi:hypothetical protein